MNLGLNLGLGVGGGVLLPAAPSEILQDLQFGVESDGLTLKDNKATVDNPELRNANCLSFDGTDYVTQTNTLDFIDIGFKFSGSFVLDDITGTKVLISQQDGTGTGYSILYISGTNMACTYGNLNQSFSTTLVANTVYTFILEYTGTRLKFTLDGSEIIDVAYAPTVGADGNIIWGAGKTGAAGLVGRMWDCGLQAPEDTRLDVIVTFGDSTNVGISEAPPSPLDQVQIHPFESYIDASRTGDPWTAEGYLQSDKAQSGLGNTWGAELELGNNISTLTGFVKVGVSGSVLGSGWIPGGGQYNQLITTVEAAFQYFVGLGYFPRISFSTVNLGTNDANTSLDDATNFDSNFLEMWRGLCSDSYFNYNTPIVLMRVNDNSTVLPYLNECAASQDRLEAKLSNLTLINTNSYELRDDRHYTADAIIEQGADQYAVYNALNLSTEVYHSLYSLSGEHATVAYNVGGGMATGAITGASRSTQDSYSHNHLYGVSKYISSDGVAQYIDIGHIATENTKVEVVAEIKDNTVLLGVRQALTDFIIQSTAGNYASQFGDANTSTGLSSFGVRTVILDKNGISVDGVNTSHGAYSFSTGGSIFLYAFNNSGTPTLYSEANIYSVKVWEDGTLVRDMTPVSGGAFYDSVGEATYTNDGTGSLVSEFVPANIYKTTDALGALITNPPGFTHNVSECDMVQVDADEAIFGGASFYGDGVTWDEKTKAQMDAHHTSSNGALGLWVRKQGDNIYRMSQYSVTRNWTTGEVERNEAYFGGGGAALRDVNGDLITDSNGYVVFAA